MTDNERKLLDAVMRGMGATPDLIAAVERERMPTGMEEEIKRAWVNAWSAERRAELMTYLPILQCRRCPRVAKRVAGSQPVPERPPMKAGMEARMTTLEKAKEARGQLKLLQQKLRSLHPVHPTPAEMASGSGHPFGVILSTPSNHRARRAITPEMW